jgi:hypothetical protein
MKYTWWKKDFIHLIGTSFLLVICPTNIWLWFLHIGFKVIVYDYSHTYNHSGLIIIDFIIAKDTIPFSVTFLLLLPNCCYMSLWYPLAKLSPIFHPKTMLHILQLSQMMCCMPWLRNPHTSLPLTLQPRPHTFATTPSSSPFRNLCCNTWEKEKMGISMRLWLWDLTQPLHCVNFWQGKKEEKTKEDEKENCPNFFHFDR